MFEKIISTLSDTELFAIVKQLNDPNVEDLGIISQIVNKSDDTFFEVEGEDVIFFDGRPQRVQKDRLSHLVALSIAKELSLRLLELNQMVVEN